MLLFFQVKEETLPRNPLAVLLFATLAAAIVVGCGGGDSDSGASVGPLSANSLSKAEYLKQTNAFCARKHRERIAAANAFLETHRTQATGGVDVLIRQIYTPAMESLINGLRELGAPQGDRQSVEALIAALEQRAKRTERGEVSESEFKRVKKAEIAGAKYGLVECHS
jgi:hypothetical protein